MKKIKDPKGHKYGIYRTKRGGVHNNVNNLRSTARLQHFPDDISIYLGFRLVVKEKNEEIDKPPKK